VKASTTISDWAAATIAGPPNSARARRFAIQTVLRYRIRPERIWHSGRTENISASGVLFRGEQACVPGSKLEISLTLPNMRAGDTGAKLVCQGVVVRTAPDADVIAVRMTSRPRLLRN
jgi:PilZ domain